MGFITDPNAILYLKSLIQKKKNRINFKSKFPGSSEEALDLLCDIKDVIEKWGDKNDRTL